MYICVGKIDLSPLSNSHEVTAEKRIDAPKSRYGALNLLSYFFKKNNYSLKYKTNKTTNVAFFKLNSLQSAFQTSHRIKMIPYI